MRKCKAILPAPSARSGGLRCGFRPVDRHVFNSGDRRFLGAVVVVPHGRARAEGRGAPGGAWWVNTDVLNDLGERFGIRSIPTMAVFAGGREVARTTGARPASDIEAFVEQSTQKTHH